LLIFANKTVDAYGVSLLVPPDLRFVSQAASLFPETGNKLAPGPFGREAYQSSVGAALDARDPERPLL